MANNREETWDDCPIRFGMGIFGDKWTLLIVRDLMFKGKKYYGEFTDPEENISTNILADRLIKLQKHEIVTKQRDPENKSRFIYSLSQKGMDLLPVMLAIIDWSEKYDPNTGVPRDFIHDLREDPVKLSKDVIDALGKQ